MYIKSIHRITCLIMAFLMFLTSTGLSIDMHFCGQHLRSINLFGKAKNCFELAAMQAHCKKHTGNDQSTQPNCEMTKKDCCHNKTLSLKADLTANKTIGEFFVSTQLQDFTLAFVAIFVQKLQTEFQPIHFIHYKPPLLFKDIPVLIQSFLL